jgi:hypothetical protein
LDKLNLQVVDTLPSNAQRSARQSICTDIVEAARSAAPRYLKVTADAEDDLVKFYKTFIQYR